MPRIGLYLEKISYTNVQFVTFILGGGMHKLNVSFMSHVYPDFRGMIFVIDSKDRDRLVEARKYFKEQVLQLQLGSPVLIFANKQDLPVNVYRLVRS
jgi:ADP-ribosylation factor 1/2